MKILHFTWYKSRYIYFRGRKSKIMKLSSTKMSFLLLLLGGSSLVAQENKKEPDFSYSVNYIIERTNHFRFELDALPLGYQGKHLSLGIGGRVVAHHFVDKLTAEANFLYRYRTGLLNETQIGFSQNDNLHSFRGIEAGFLLSYSLSKKLGKKDEYVTLNESRSVKTVSKLPTSFFKMIDLRLGMVIFDLPSQLTFESSTVYDNNLVYFMQNTRALSLGVSFKKIQHEVFTTNVFGNVTHSNYGDFFIDILYGLAPSFPDALYRTTYAENNNLYEPNAYNIASSTDYNNVLDGLQYNRLGGQIGYRTGKMRNGLGATIAVAYRPGYFSNAERSYLDNITANLTIAYHFVTRKK